MLPHHLAILQRDLDGLASEIRLYPDDESLWRVVPGCPNAGGNLALHLVGNLRHFIGAKLGHTSYQRDREAEFSARGASRQELLMLVAAAKAEVSATLSALDQSALDVMMTLPGPGDRVATTGIWLMHLVAHLGYHLGQIDYHRRTITGDAAGANMLSVPALAAGDDG